MTKTLLLISGGEKSVEIVRGLRAMGHAVVVSDSDPQAPALALADSCLIADVHGASETAAAAERYSRKIRKIDGLLSVADAPLTAAMVTERFRLPGPAQNVFELMADLLLIRRSFASAGIAAPWHAEIFTPQDLQRAAIARGRGLVVKPVENRGSAGVTIRLSSASRKAVSRSAIMMHTSTGRGTGLASGARSVAGAVVTG